MSLLPLAAAHAETNTNTHQYEVLHSFNGADGAQPMDTVAKDQSGNLVGTTNVGGSNNVGTVYKIAPDGTFATLYSFCNCLDAKWPQATPRLTIDRAGNIYGTSNGGGLFGDNLGTIFKIKPDGTEKVRYSFSSADGADPVGGVILEKGTHNLYGTTEGSGGTAFKLAPDGTFTTLHVFGTGSDGGSPSSGLLEDTQRNLYGTTLGGGTSGGGTVYKIAADGTESVLYSFTGGSDGALPYSTLIADASGNLYGTASAGGTGGGTVFKIAPDGTETTLHTFTGGQDGYTPYASLAMDRNGNLYGTTFHGGANSKGTVFKLTGTGTETILHSFGSVDNDGAYPYEGVTLVGKYLYGTTGGGGTANDGVVFRLKK